VSPNAEDYIIQVTRQIMGLGKSQGSSHALEASRLKSYL